MQQVEIIWCFCICWAKERCGFCVHSLNMCFVYFNHKSRASVVILSWMSVIMFNDGTMMMKFENSWRFSAFFPKCTGDMWTPFFTKTCILWKWNILYIIWFDNWFGFVCIFLSLISVSRSPSLIALYSGSLGIGRCVWAFLRQRTAASPRLVIRRWLLHMCVLFVLFIPDRFRCGCRRRFRCCATAPVVSMLRFVYNLYARQIHIFHKHVLVNTFFFCIPVCSECFFAYIIIYVFE